MTSKLRTRVLKASAWSSIGYGISQLIRFLGNLVMARLLMPDAFGLMAIAWTVMTGLSMVSDTGIRQCIVQSKNGDHPNFLNTAWTIQIIRGSLLTIAAFIIAGLIKIGISIDLFKVGSVYSDTTLPPIIVVVAFTAFIAGFESTKLWTANRNLAITKVVLVEITSQIIGLTFMILWATIDQSIWALAAGGLVSGLSRVSLGHLLLPGVNNSIHWEKTFAIEIKDFGKWIFLSSLLGYVVNNGDRIILAVLTDAHNLGQYVVAFLIVDGIRSIVLRISNSAALPALSETIRKSPDRIRSTFYKLRIPIDIIMLCSLGLLFTTSHAIVNALYDERYQLSGLFIQALSVSLFETRYEIATQCYLAMGKSKLITPILISRIIPLIVITPLAFNYGGLTAAVWAIALTPLACIPVHLVIMHRNNILDIKKELLVIPSLLIGFSLGHALLLITQINP